MSPNFASREPYNMFLRPFFDNLPHCHAFAYSRTMPEPQLLVGTELNAYYNSLQHSFRTPRADKIPVRTVCVVVHAHYPVILRRNVTKCSQLAHILLSESTDKKSETRNFNMVAKRGSYDSLVGDHTQHIAHSSGTSSMASGQDIIGPCCHVSSF